MMDKAVVCCSEHFSPDKGGVSLTAVLRSQQGWSPFPGPLTGIPGYRVRTQEPFSLRSFSGQNCPSLVFSSLATCLYLGGLSLLAGLQWAYSNSVRCRLSRTLESYLRDLSSHPDAPLATNTTNATASNFRFSRTHGIRQKVRSGCEAQQSVD